MKRRTVFQIDPNPASRVRMSAGGHLSLNVGNPHQNEGDADATDPVARTMRIACKNAPSSLCAHDLNDESNWPIDAPGRLPRVRTVSQPRRDTTTAGNTRTRAVVRQHPMTPHALVPRRCQKDEPRSISHSRPIAIQTAFRERRRHDKLIEFPEACHGIRREDSARMVEAGKTIVAG